MSRGTSLAAPIAAPIVRELPAIYRDDAFIAEFTHGLDRVLAPTVTSLDSLDAYVDPHVAPSDFVDWLSTWVGMAIDEDWELGRRRELVAAAVELFGRRGTLHGLRDEVALYTEGEVTIDDPGGTYTATTPSGAFDQPPPSAERTVRVTVDVADHETVNWPGLQAVIRDAVPAHLPVEIDLREGATS